MTNHYKQVPAPLLTRRVSLVEQELFSLSLCCLSFFDVLIGYYVFVYVCSGISAVFLHIEFEWRFVAVICFMILYLILFEVWLNKIETWEYEVGGCITMPYICFSIFLSDIKYFTLRSYMHSRTPCFWEQTSWWIMH
jgi:hypothetical protein